MEEQDTIQALKEQLLAAERRAEEAERQRQPTTLAEYIDACHTKLFEKFTVQTNKSLTSQGGLTKPQGKRLPTRLVPWSDFLDQQKGILGKLYSLYPQQSRKFENLDFLLGLGMRIARRPVGTEKALELMQHQIVETPVTTIVDGLREAAIGGGFDLGGGVVFESHPNVASDVAEEPRARLTSQLALSRGAPNPDLRQLRADQICVYKCDEDDATRRRMAFVVEYKAPHKLTLPHLRLGLREMDIYTEVVNRAMKPAAEDTEALFQYTSDKLAAAAVAQTFHYMIEGGLDYSYLTTGEAFVFLKIDWNDPDILYYHLAEPGQEVQAHPENSRHCTAVSQVLAFTLAALASPVHAQEERHRAIERLKTWNEDVESILHAIPASERKQSPPPSAFVPKTYKHVDRSPYYLRRGKRQNPSTCHPDSSSANDMHSHEPSDDESREPFTPTQPRRHTPSTGARRPRGDGPGSSAHGTQNRPYCTQACLLGLVRGGSLDEGCPNVSLHRGGQHEAQQGHPICHETWLCLLREQLAQTLDHNVEPLWTQGARGIMFKVTLGAYGYTVIAKGTVLAFVEDLQHEAVVYRRLQHLQGVCVPVLLGAVDLDRPYYYDLQVRVVHMMFLSWAGACIDDGDITKDVQQKRRQELVRSVHAVHAMGVVHGDIRAANALWNSEVHRVMVIDFERAVLHDPSRTPLSPRSPNSKKQRSSGKVGEPRGEKWFREMSLEVSAAGVVE